LAGKRFKEEFATVGRFNCRLSLSATFSNGKAGGRLLNYRK
jgi:hypothetical protein